MIRPAVALEATVLVVIAGVLVVTDRTLTAWHKQIRRHPVGLLAMGAATGAGIVHLWLDDRRITRTDPVPRPVGVGLAH